MRSTHAWWRCRNPECAQKPFQRLPEVSERTCPRCGEPVEPFVDAELGEIADMMVRNREVRMQEA